MYTISGVVKYLIGSGPLASINSFFVLQTTNQLHIKKDILMVESIAVCKAQYRKCN